VRYPTPSGTVRLILLLLRGPIYWPLVYVQRSRLNGAENAALLILSVSWLRLVFTTATRRAPKAGPAKCSALGLRLKDPEVRLACQGPSTPDCRP
jgi:hypothetical protein